MANLKKDIKYAKGILDGTNMGKFDYIYSRSNENLIELFNRLNLCGQDVYTVLSSSDFLLSAVHQGAKKVDCFDMMALTYRYFHLRKWLAQYGYIDANGLTKSSLLQLLKNKNLKLNSKDERESLLFWEQVLKQVFNTYIYDTILFEPGIKGTLICDNMREIAQKLDEYENILFENIDICEEIKYDEERKYDVVYLSNIVDHNRERLKIEKLILNLLKLLKDDGSIICTHMSLFEDFELEQEIFSEHFDYDEIFVDKTRLQEITYYRYRKK